MQVRPLAFALAVLLLPTADARIDACDCIRLQPLSIAVRKEAPFIFEGKVIEIVERSLHTLRTTSGGGSSETQPMGREVVFEVTRAWNGVTTKRLTVSADESDCMFPFKIDQTYVVFAWKDAKGGPATSICTRTMESSSAAEVIAQLGPATIPKSP
ncbi:MAG TPA: hypothetical protein VF921_08760 [Vicinamibacterales bacterium]